MYAKIFQGLIQNFFRTMGRAPGTPKEWSKLRAKAMELARKEEDIPTVTSKTTLEDVMRGPVMSKGGPKGDRIWDFSKKKGEVVDLFASEKEFGEDLYSIGQNFIKNDPMFNLELATTFRNPGTKTYSAFGSGKLHSPGQRQKILDKLKKIMKHEEYQTQHAEELDLVDLTDDIFTIEKASGGRIGRYEGGIAPLVGEPSYAADFYDDRTPYKTGLKVYPKIEIRKSGSTPAGVDVDKRDTTYGGTGLIEGDKWYGGAELLKRKSKVDVTADGQTVYKDTTSPEDTVNWVLGYGEPEGDKFQIKADEDADNFGIVFKKKLKKKPKYIFKKAQGGRIGLAGGGALKKFIEKLFIKASNDIRQGKGKWKGIDQKERIVQHDNLTKKLTEWEKTGNTEGLEVYFGVNPHEAFAASSKKVKKTVPEVSGIDDALKSDFEKSITDMTKEEKAARLKKYQAENPNIKLSYGDKDSIPGDEGIMDAVRKGKAQRAEIEAQRVDKDRKLTKEEWKDFVEDNSGDLNEELLTGDETLNDLENMVAEQKAYEAEMYADYKSGALDKYVKPEELEKQRLFRQKKIDNVLAKAYDEVFYQKPVTGDYKYDADVLSDSIAEQLGKGSFTDLPQTHQTQIYNTALKRVTQDMKMKQTLKDVEQKMQLSDFDPKDRLPNQSGGPINQQALIQMYLEEGLSYDEAVAAAQSTAGLDMDLSKKAEGGRAEFIYGGSAGLRALLKRLRGKNKRIFPSPPQGIKKFMGKGDTDYIDTLKLQQLETILKAAKIDKDLIAQMAKNKKMADPGLDFLMGKMDEMGLMPKNISKYTDVDKDIMDVEMMIKNYSDKKLKRKPHNLGGRIGYAGGGKAGLPAITQGPPQGPGMQQPQMPAMGPQPAGIPGGTLVAQNQMQQNPWMGQNPMMGQKPPMGGMPRPMAAEGGRIGFKHGGSWADWMSNHSDQMTFEEYLQIDMDKPVHPINKSEGGRIGFGLGGFNKARRAFLKLIGGITAGGVAAGTGLLKLGKAAKVAPKVTEEVIKRGADGMPAYVTDLITVVKAKGTRDIIEGYKKSDYSTVHSYKGVDVVEHPSGTTTIKKGQEKAMYGSDEPSYHEIEMEIIPGEYIQKGSTVSDDAAKAVKEADQYVEYTAKPDMDGKLKDVEEYIDDVDHLELKEISDEIWDMRQFPDMKPTDFASGGLAYALGE